MIGILIGAAAAVGVAKFAGRHRFHGYGRHHHGFGHGHQHAGFGGRGSGRFGRRMLRGVFERLDTSPGQEKVILEAVDAVQEAAKRFRGEAGQTREAFAKAMSGEHFESATVNEAYARHDELLKNLRETASAQMSRVHEALDERQRRELADLLRELGPGSFGRGGFGRGFRGRGGGFRPHPRDDDDGRGGPWDSHYA